ncbi:hypothetical protein AAV33_09655, partial [Corynebacterium otitidis]
LTEPLTGFENHIGGTILGPNARPLGTITTGTGNTDANSAAALLASVLPVPVVIVPSGRALGPRMVPPMWFSKPVSGSVS